MWLQRSTEGASGLRSPVARPLPAAHLKGAARAKHPSPALGSSSRPVALLASAAAPIHALLLC